MSFESLLLLPQHPTSVTPASLSAAYQPSISACLSILKKSTTSIKLTVAIASANFHERLNTPRSQIYNEVERLLGRIYSLISLICAKQDVDVISDLAGAVDIRVILLDYEHIRSMSATLEINSNQGISVAGPIVDLSTFASTRRQWSRMFSVEGEGGQELFRDYLDLANRISPPIDARSAIALSGGISMVEKCAPLVQPSFSVSHNVVAVGGTFDHLHAGHKLLLTATALLLQPATSSWDPPRRMIIGITGDELLRNKKYAEYLQSWEQRENDVVDFLISILSFTLSSNKDAVQKVKLDTSSGRAIHTKLNTCSITIECVEIQDAYGPTITDESVTALVVSGETRSGGQAVNDKRKEKGWKGLEVYEVDVLDAQDNAEPLSKPDDFTSKISSTAIRKQTADRARVSSL